jgi:GNAT superfamily N-acetyltransferase
MTSASLLTLRRARPEDVEFAFRVLEETMREYAVATWGTWWEEQSRRETVEQVSAGRTEIIELDGQPMGVHLVDRPGTHFQLVQLYIAKEFQRRGFGTELLQRLFVEAKAANLPIRLRVLAVNPARALYERLGFVVVERTPERYFMEWVPNISIREATCADAGQIASLLRSLSHTFTTYADGTGAEAFFARLTESAIAAVLASSDAVYWVAESNSDVVAVAGLRGNERISHLFVEPKYQGLGLARKLWGILRDQALRAGNPGVFTVNSSLVAVPVYQRFGFVVAGAKVEKDGGAYVPMRLERTSANQ